MTAPSQQRWRDGRSSFRSADETIATRLYEVATIESDNDARTFVEHHHYSASYPAARERVGLYRGGHLEGVAVFSHPVNERTLDVTRASPGAACELGRFVLLDAVPGNGETWFLARCFELLAARGYEAVVSFSDPCARHRADGSTIFPGHVGTIYQAFNAVFLGRSKPGVLTLLPDGRAIHPRALTKIRRGERGHEPAMQRLVSAGADEPVGDRTAWLERALARVTRRVPHPGNFKYAWGIGRRAKARLPPSLPYPKLRDPQASFAWTH